MSCCKSYIMRQRRSTIIHVARTRNQSLLHQTWNTQFRPFGKHEGSPRFRRGAPHPHRTSGCQTSRSLNTHVVNRECTYIRSFSASEPCTTILFNICNHIPPTPQFFWYSSIGDIVVQLHGVENLGRYHFRRRKVFWATGNEGFSPR